MNIEGIRMLYNNSIENMFKPDRFRSIASHKCNVNYYSFINRIIIRMQNRYCTDVRSEEAWKLDNRSVINGVMPIYVISYIEKFNYMDRETSKEISLQDLTPMEIKLAVSLGIIQKVLKDESVLLDDYFRYSVYTYFDMENNNECKKIELYSR